MRNVWLIARREYLVRVRSRAFMMTTILVPALVALIVAVLVFANTKAGGGKHLVIASSDAPLAQSVRDNLVHMRSAQMRVEVSAPASEADRAQQLQRLDNKEIDGLVWLETVPGKPQPVTTYTSHSAGDVFTEGRLQDAIGRAVMDEQLTARGMTKDEIHNLTRDISVDMQQIKSGKTSASSAGGSLIGAWLMAGLLYGTVLFYGMNVGRSVIEEKTSRIFEVMLATVKPEDMMAGKLLGVGFSALTQIGIWMGLGALLVGSAVATRALPADFHLGITPILLASFFIYFILGFLLYSALSAAFGAMCSAEQELQQFQMFLVLPMLLSFYMTSYVLGNPGGPLTVALSLFPPFTPIIMLIRMAAQQPPAWQIGASIVLTGLSIWFMLWLSSRIYRVGILMYGKRATLPEVMRWLRYS